MTFFISLAYIILSTIICFRLYTWSATFKEISEYPEEHWDDIAEEVSELRGEIVQLSPSQKKFIKYGNKALFLTIGCLVWVIMGITVGKIASSITDHYILKWLAYIGMYFLFLRIPFGVANGMIRTIHEIKQFPEKALFSILMIGFYVLSICCYVALPSFLKWHLFLLP